MKAVLWARVSDPRRKEEKEGDYAQRVQQDLENQLRPLRELAGRFGWEVAAEVRAETSAWNTDPPEKAALLKRLEAGGVDLVAVWSIDRWSRKKPTAVLNEIEFLEHHLGVKFYSIQQAFLSTATLPDGMRQMLIGLFAWIAENESSTRSARVKAAVATKRARAGTIGRSARWGRGKIPSNDEASRIRARWAEDPHASLRKLADEFGFGKSTVERLVKDVRRAGPGPSAGPAADDRDHP